MTELSKPELDNVIEALDWLSWSLHRGTYTGPEVISKRDVDDTYRKMVTMRRDMRRAASIVAH